MTPPICKCLRWAVNLKQIEPVAEADFRLAMQAVQPEECARVQRFVYRDDQLVSLIGRLCLRQAVRKHTDAAWTDISFERTKKGKPYLVTPTSTPDFSYNVSHQGDYVIFGSSCSKGGIGVDVMKLEQPKRYKTADEYIDFLKKEFSPAEYSSMKSQKTEADKLLYFYRYWCLKESIIKATGIGIHDKLSSLDFQAGPESLSESSVLLDTVLIEDNIPQYKWTFEESYLNDKHVVAVCRQTNVPEQCTLNDSKMRFQHVRMHELLEGAQVLNPLPEDARAEYEAFNVKKYKHF